MFIPPRLSPLPPDFSTENQPEQVPSGSAAQRRHNNDDAVVRQQESARQRRLFEQNFLVIPSDTLQDTLNQRQVSLWDGEYIASYVTPLIDSLTKKTDGNRRRRSYAETRSWELPPSFANIPNEAEAWMAYIRDQMGPKQAARVEEIRIYSNWAAEIYRRSSQDRDALLDAIRNYANKTNDFYVLMNAAVSGMGDQLEDFVDQSHPGQQHSAEDYANWCDKVSPFFPEVLADYKYEENIPSDSEIRLPFERLADEYEMLARQGATLNDFLSVANVPTDGLLIAKGLNFKNPETKEPIESEALAFVDAFLRGDMLLWRGIMSTSTDLEKAGEFIAAEMMNGITTIDLSQRSFDRVHKHAQFLETYRATKPHLVLVAECHGTQGAFFSESMTGDNRTEDELAKETDHVILPKRVIITDDCWVLLGHLKAAKADPATGMRPDGLWKYSQEDIDAALFNGVQDLRFPESRLNGRHQNRYLPRVALRSIKPLGAGFYSSRISLYSGGITDIKATQNEIMAIACSNNGDLFTGCGYAIAKAIINAAGGGLQKELYDRFGTPIVMGIPQYGRQRYAHTEGRGYSLICSPHDMAQTHNLHAIEYMTVPMHSLDGLFNMYREALLNSRSRHAILLPMAGMSHPLLEDRPELSAQVATQAAKAFYDQHPDSRLRVIFVIFDDPRSLNLYWRAVQQLDQGPAPTLAANAAHALNRGR